jgi:hypothetical protein
MENEKREKKDKKKRTNKSIFFVNTGFSRVVPGLLVLGGGHGLATSQFRVL